MNVRPASVAYFPLAIFAAFVGLIFALQLVGLLVLVDLGIRPMTAPDDDVGPALAALHRVRVANYPPARAPARGVSAEPAAADDLQRSVPIVLDELETYGEAVLGRTPLRRVVLASNLRLEGSRVGGITVGNRGLILLDVGWSGAQTRELLRHAIHHEMSHVLDDALGHDDARDDGWSRLNHAQFRYGGEEIVRALDVLGEDPGRRPDGPGFVTYYAMVSPREDRAEIFALRMTRPWELGRVVEDDPVIEAKCRRLEAELVRWDRGFARVLAGPPRP